MKGVYGIVNRKTGQMYIGSSQDIENRWNHHRSTLKFKRHHCVAFQTAWEQFGEEGFMFVVLEACRRESDVRMKERYWLAKLHERCYNNGS